MGSKNVRHGRNRKRSLLLDWMIFPAWMIYSRAKRRIGKGPAPLVRRRVAARHASRRTVMLRVRRPKKILRGVSIMASAVCLFTGVPTAMVGISRRIPGMNNASFIALVLYRLKSDARHRAHRFFIELRAWRNQHVVTYRLARNRITALSRQGVPPSRGA